MRDSLVLPLFDLVTKERNFDVKGLGQKDRIMDHRPCGRSEALSPELNGGTLISFSRRVKGVKFPTRRTLTNPNVEMKFVVE